MQQVVRFIRNKFEERRRVKIVRMMQARSKIEHIEIVGTLLEHAGFVLSEDEKVIRVTISGDTIEFLCEMQDGTKRHESIYAPDVIVYWSLYSLAMDRDWREKIRMQLLREIRAPIQEASRAA